MRSKKHNRDVVKALSMVSQIGITMLVPIVLCFFFGRWLDNMLGTGCMMIIFTVLGILAAYRNLFAITGPLLKGERERENETYHKKSQSPADDDQRDADRADHRNFSD